MVMNDRTEREIESMVSAKEPLSTKPYWSTFGTWPIACSSRIDNHSVRTINIETY